MSSTNRSEENLSKQAAGKAAADLIERGMLVGLGTGSTAACFIEALCKRVKEGLRVSAVATSNRSAELATKGGIEILDINTITSIDITVDGADEIDPQNRMIKGGGGAHLREKIVAAMSEEMVVIIDPSKEVSQLGSVPLPVEIIPFAFRATIHHINQAGFKGSLRHQPDGALFTTDCRNYIYDIQFPSLIQNPENIALTLKEIPGVVETGFFFGMASKVIVGYPDGSTKIRT